MTEEIPKVEKEEKSYRGIMTNGTGYYIGAVTVKARVACTIGW